MPAVQTAIYDRIRTDTALTAAQPTGQGFLVWNRWLVAGTGLGATPEAFQPPTTGGAPRMRRNVVVLDGGEVGHPQGDGGWKLRRWDSFPSIYLFAPVHATDKAAIEAAERRIEQLLVGWEAVLPSGERASFRPENRIALEDSEQFPGALVSIVRYRATGSRSLVA